MLTHLLCCAHCTTAFFTIYVLNRTCRYMYRYMYIQAQSPFGDCGGNITDAENGIIKSPNFPEKYTTSSKGSVFDNIFLKGK